MMNKKESESSSVIQEDLSKSTSTPHPLDMISVTVAPFTGGPFLLRINKRDSVEELKRRCQEVEKFSRTGYVYSIEKVNCQKEVWKMCLMEPELSRLKGLRVI
ncbi:unnamed protein product [Lepeophtheirus salmonis]|uniref:(salmon louse) hypothetical protein n=1 Tax=Lepeophtheirus salmonis TaxID=72036 RepID=A0A7R8CQ83_LEPSM|nr:unnamed protein product [Lepeophtheirus salmonis]CAF2890742.1 unnamed protein product [Lepeophtheirus salmonis]